MLPCVPKAPKRGKGGKLPSLARRRVPASNSSPKRCSIIGRLRIYEENSIKLSARRSDNRQCVSFCVNTVTPRTHFLPKRVSPPLSKALTRRRRRLVSRPSKRFRRAENWPSPLINSRPTQRSSRPIERNAAAEMPSLWGQATPPPPIGSHARHLTKPRVQSLSVPKLFLSRRSFESVSDSRQSESGHKRPLRPQRMGGAQSLTHRLFGAINLGATVVIDDLRESGAAAAISRCARDLQRRAERSERAREGNPHNKDAHRCRGASRTAIGKLFYRAGQGASLDDKKSQNVFNQRTAANSEVLASRNKNV